MTAREWIDAFATELGTDPPTDAEIEQILDLAGVAAHSSERIAAPVACWIGGLSGASIAQLRAVADSVATESTPSDAA